ncbi:hypothetical protein HanXRQr2_Chr10g0450481 [Helianthus annuus]|uniref:Uncharacterized protein n=1 Tax=Helianthus annuus TaxID=4232 RepID=A0A9K3N4Z1_HELAN|nr:hypothetical protein HanXRQr2_Chr10g0450481 [Helianthus annuus]KAJ0884527.1 hypothetical protein HanPSC8_Chr10g0434711 [Helianthus annuus]
MQIRSNLYIIIIHNNILGRGLGTVPVSRFSRPSSAGHSHLYTNQRIDISSTKLYHQQPANHHPAPNPVPATSTSSYYHRSPPLCSESTSPASIDQHRSTPNRKVGALSTPSTDNFRRTIRAPTGACQSLGLF